MSLLSAIKTVLPAAMWQRLRPVAVGILYRNDLSRIAASFYTDKWGQHWYTQHYLRYFFPWKKKRLNLLEIGVGGYEDSSEGGGSLRMWKAFFPKAKIVGIDIHDKTQFSEPRIDIRVCDQTDAAMLRKLSEEYGGFDIVIDDGSHLNAHVIETFGILFPLLRTPGIYTIEDVQTSYWPGWGGGLDNPESIMAFFKGLTDGLNHVEFPVENYAPNYFEKHIVEIAFFHNLIVIRKDDYNERTNAPELVQREIAAAVNPV